MEGRQPLTRVAFVYNGTKGHFQDIKPRKHAENLPLKSSKNETSNTSALFVSYLQHVSQYEYALQFSGSTVGSEAHMGRGVHSLKLM